MAKPIIPIDKERHFEAHELFFSTTDLRGVIQSGNRVFVRVSGYQIDELVGKPHNIIRHPDVPRAVFQLLWQYLEAGKTFAGYVKNMAKDGRYYWVMALVTPIGDRYLSVRFKPSHLYLPTVAGLYDQMHDMEVEAGDEPHERREGMRQATELLGAALMSLGFRDYDDFMYKALSEEIALRNREHWAVACDAPRDSRIDGSQKRAKLALTMTYCARLSEQLACLALVTDELLGINRNLKSKSEFLLTLSSHIHLISMNVLIASHRNGQSGQALAVIAEHMAKFSDSGSHLITDMTDRISLLVRAVSQSAFAIAAMRLQVEMTISFLSDLLAAPDEDGDEWKRVEADIETMCQSFAIGSERIRASVAEIDTPIRSLVNASVKLTVALKRLENTHFAGKIEAFRVNDGSSLLILFRDAHDRIETAHTELHELCAMTDLLTGHVRQVQQSGAAIHGAIQAFGTA